jgi:hypothetical protein
VDFSFRENFSLLAFVFKVSLFSAVRVSVALSPSTSRDVVSSLRESKSQRTIEERIHYFWNLLGVIY